MKRPSPGVMTIIAALCVAVPLLTWQRTWFGTKLSDAQMKRYLNDDGSPRRIQHALAQISDRIQRSDTKVRTWYPRVAALAHHALVPVRITSAWVLGQDNSSSLFHETLLGLLGDPEPMVRRNAALSLVRFGDGSGRPELRGMLGAYKIRAPVSGRFTTSAASRGKVGAGTLLAVVQPREGQRVEIRSSFAGDVAGILARDGSWVEQGQDVVSINSGTDQIWEALRGLYLIGQAEDLDIVESYARSVSNRSDSLKKQAEFTAHAIRARLGPTPNR